jgi:hypothetical protein
MVQARVCPIRSLVKVPHSNFQTLLAVIVTAPAAYVMIRNAFACPEGRVPTRVKRLICIPVLIIILQYD